MEDITKMFGQLQEAQTKAQEIQEKVSQLQASGTSGAGAVTATVQGNKNLISLSIDKEYIDPKEPKMLEDLIVAAVNLANSAVEEQIQEELKKHTEGLLGGLPIELMR